MKYHELEHLPEESALSPESQDRARLINKTILQLENLSDFGLDLTDGRDGFYLALDNVFSNIEKIEGEDKTYEVTKDGIISGRIRDTYLQLFNGLNTEGAKPDSEFYIGLERLMTVIEERGRRFVEDMPEYQRWHDEQKQA